MIYLHLGAHKTATTYLQDLFALNQGRIARGGRGYWRLDQIRPVIRQAIETERRLDGLRFGRLRRRLRAPGQPFRQLLDMVDISMPSIISDENIIGNPSDVLRGVFYVNAGERLRRVAVALGPRETEIWLCVRAYPAFLASLFSEALRHGYHASIEEFVERNASPQGGWPSLVRTIHGCFPAARIRVWPFEDFRALRPHLVERLCGLPLPDLRPLPVDDIRPSPSARAVEAQLRETGGMSPRERTLFMSAMEEEYPAGPDAAKFDPWESDVREHMWQAYREDLATISGLPYVEFLEKPAEQGPVRTAS